MKRALCIPRACVKFDLPASERCVLDVSLSEFNDCVEPAKFVDRQICETNPTWLQIIPYTVLVHYDQDFFPHVLAYSRVSCGDQRLEGKSSIGIGGHIEPVDFGITGELGVSQVLDTGLMTGDTFIENMLGAGCREILEEAGVEVMPSELRHLGLIYDPTDLVGQVHLGILSVLRLDEQSARELHTGEELYNPQWLPLETLDPDCRSYENWTRVTLAYLQNKLPGFALEPLELFTAGKHLTKRHQECRAALDRISLHRTRYVTQLRTDVGNEFIHDNALYSCEAGRLIQKEIPVIK